MASDLQHAGSCGPQSQRDVLLCNNQVNPFPPERRFLGVGTENTPSMTGDLALIGEPPAARLFAALEIVSRRFASRDHANVLPETFREGLPALFR